MKKRYQVSLDEESVIEFQKVATSLGFDRKIMSAICNEAIKKTCLIFKKAQDKGGVTMVDLFTMIGEEVESIEESERMKNTCPKCGRPMHKFHDCVLNPYADPEGINKEREKKEDDEKGKTSKKGKKGTQS